MDESNSCFTDHFLRARIVSKKLHPWPKYDPVFYRDEVAMRWIEKKTIVEIDVFSELKSMANEIAHVAALAKTSYAIEHGTSAFLAIDVRRIADVKR